MTQVLVQWQGECKEDATWEILYDLQAVRMYVIHMLGTYVTILCN